MMDDFDRNNFNWYTSASEEELTHWYANADISELRYMLSLIQEEITNLKLEKMDELESAIDNYSDPAKDFLNKFSLKG